MGSVFKVTRKYANGKEVDYWVIKYQLNGKSIQERLGRVGKMTKTAASEVLKKRERAIDGGKYKHIVGNPTLAEYGRLFREFKDNGKEKQATMVNYCLKHFEEMFGTKKLKDITHEDVEKYVRYRLEEGKKPSSIIREISEIRFLFNSAELDDKFQGRNPVSHFLALDRRGRGKRDGQGRLLRIRKGKKVKPLTDIEFRSIIQACDFVKKGDLIRDMILLGFSLSARTEEVYGLKWSWIVEDPLGSYCVFPLDATKDEEDRVVPIKEWAKEILNRRKAQASDSDFVFPNPETDSKHVEYSTYEISWREIKKIVGINREIHLKDVMRHYSLTKSTEKGSTLAVESKYLGHASIRTTETYYLRPDKGLNEAADIRNQVLDELLGVDFLVDSPKSSDEKLM